MRYQNPLGGPPSPSNADHIVWGKNPDTGPYIPGILWLVGILAGVALFLSAAIR